MHGVPSRQPGDLSRPRNASRVLPHSCTTPNCPSHSRTRLSVIYRSLPSRTSVMEERTPLSLAFSLHLRRRQLNYCSPELSRSRLLRLPGFRWSHTPTPSSLAASGLKPSPPHPTPSYPTFTPSPLHSTPSTRPWRRFCSTVSRYSPPPAPSPHSLPHSSPPHLHRVPNHSSTNTWEPAREK